MKFLGTIPFGIKAFQLSTEEPETSIEEPPQIQPASETFRVYPDPGVCTSASAFAVTGLQFWSPDDPD